MAAEPKQIPAALEEPINDFITTLELERGRSPRTIEAYQNDLGQCARFLTRVLNPNPKMPVPPSIAAEEGGH